MLAGRAPRVVISVGRGASAGMGFHYSSRKPDALPTQIRANVASAAFECIIPSAAGNSMPARISLYGHRLLGSHSDQPRPHGHRQQPRPHQDVRDTPAARLQKSDFLAPDGAIVDVCGGRPCHTSVYAPLRPGVTDLVS